MAKPKDRGLVDGALVAMLPQQAGLHSRNGWIVGFLVSTFGRYSGLLHELLSRVTVAGTALNSLEQYKHAQAGKQTNHERPWGPAAGFDGPLLPCMEHRL